MNVLRRISSLGTCMNVLRRISSLCINQNTSILLCIIPNIWAFPEGLKVAGLMPICDSKKKKQIWQNDSWILKCFTRSQRCLFFHTEDVHSDSSMHYTPPSTSFSWYPPILSRNINSKKKNSKVKHTWWAILILHTQPRHISVRKKAKWRTKLVYGPHQVDLPKCPH